MHIIMQTSTTSPHKKKEQQIDLPYLRLYVLYII